MPGEMSKDQAQSHTVRGYSPCRQFSPPEDSGTAPISTAPFLLVRKDRIIDSIEVYGVPWPKDHSSRLGGADAADATQCGRDPAGRELRRDVRLHGSRL
jgi:hypothetical protein